MDNGVISDSVLYEYTTLDLVYASAGSCEHPETPGRAGVLPDLSAGVNLADPMPSPSPSLWGLQYPLAQPSESAGSSRSTFPTTESSSSASGSSPSSPSDFFGPVSTPGPRQTTQSTVEPSRIFKRTSQPALNETLVASSSYSGPTALDPREAASKATTSDLDDQTALIQPPPQSTAISPYSSDSSRWTAILSRSPLADPYFIFCVLTTRIYCRPSCPSRRPLRHNVIFHPTPLSASLAGFRACKRCTPDKDAGLAETQQAEKVGRVKVMIEEAGREGRVMKLEELARVVGWSRCYLQKVFKRRVGVTAERYGRAWVGLMEVGRGGQESGEEG